MVYFDIEFQIACVIFTKYRIWVIKYFACTFIFDKNGSYKRNTGFGTILSILNFRVFFMNPLRNEVRIWILLLFIND